MSERYGTCSERIPSQLASRLETFQDIDQRAQSDDEETADAASDERYEMPLAVEVRRVVRIDLSTGGPADWFEVQVDEDGDPTRIEYHFADWFDHASVVLDGDKYDQALTFLGPLVEAAVLS